MNTLRRIKRQQRHWAFRHAEAADGAGYLPSVRANLFQAMTAPTKIAFSEGSGSELKDRAGRPAKMRALHSSSALAVNVFDYWVSRDCRPLQQAIGMQSAIDAIAFEAQYPTGLSGSAPHLDISITAQSGFVFALESKFTEWLTRKDRKSDAPFKAKYFANQAKHWQSAGLPKCQQLASAMYAGYKRGDRGIFRHLDAPQLLKHALGLATSLKEFSLGYIYYDTPGPETAHHKSEIEEFNHRVGAELNFQAMSYQSFFQKLKDNTNEDSDYLNYLESRYFPVA